MSGVYKTLQPKDIRSTPYRAHKTLITTFTGGEPDNDDCKVYLAEHSLSSSYNFYPQGISNIDNFNPYYTGAFATTTDGYYKKAIHAQLDHLFYREYLTNNKATLGGGAPINLQYRDLGRKAQVISFPTKKVGEGILPESLQITSSNYNIKDDKFGNLVFDDSTDAADYDNVMMSYTFNKHYEYIDEGPVGMIEQPITYGGSSMPATYTNVAFAQHVSEVATVTTKFDKAVSSSIKLQGSTNDKMVYNMMNTDYAIAFSVKVASNSAGQTILSKQDTMTDVAVDADGQLYTDVNTPSQYPYKITVDGSNRLVFSKSNTSQTFTLTSSALTLNNWYHVVVQRVGTTFTMYVSTQSPVTGTDPFLIQATGSLYGNGQGTIRSREQDCSNRSNIYIGNNYNKTAGLTGEIGYIHIFDRSLTTNEISNLSAKKGWLGNYCGNVFYNLGIVVLTHPLLNTTTEEVEQTRAKGTVSMRELQAYCTVGPGDYNITNNRSIQFWNPVTNTFEIDARYLSSSFKPYVTTIGLYNDNNELLAVGKLSTPMQTSRTTDTTFVVKFDF
jgi:hypothetical protein